MSLVWLTTSFCYFLLLTLVNTFDHIYPDALIGSATEMMGYILSGLLASRVGIKYSLMFSFAISCIGGTITAAWGLWHMDSPWFFVLFLLCKLGIAYAANINFIANSVLFPTLFASTALGICNFLGRSVSTFSFYIVYMQEPTPMILFSAMTGLTSILAFFLKSPEKINVAEELRQSIMSIMD